MDTTNNNDVTPFWLKIVYIICSLLIATFTILLIIVYSKDKYFHGTKNKKISDMYLYPCYFNIFFCIIIAANNIIRLIPFNITVIPEEPEGQENIVCKTQAFLASLFDKLLVSLMTIYSIVNYLSVFKSDFYKKYIKRIYIILIFIGFCFSLMLTIIYYRDGISEKDILCYIHTRTTTKIVTDDIYTSILFLINLFCLIRLIVYLGKLSKQYSSEGKMIQFKKSTNYLNRFVLDLIINLIAFAYIFMVINKLLPKGSYKDLIFTIICLIVELFFTLNKSLYYAFIRVLSCNKYYKITDEPDNNDNDLENNNNEINEDLVGNE